MAYLNWIIFCQEWTKKINRYMLKQQEFTWNLQKPLWEKIGCYSVKDNFYTFMVIVNSPGHSYIGHCQLSDPFCHNGVD